LWASKRKPDKLLGGFLKKQQKIAKIYQEKIQNDDFD
jgi:hypothetical protein